MNSQLTPPKPVRMSPQNMASLQRISDLISVKEAVTLNLWDDPSQAADPWDYSSQLAAEIKECAACRPGQPDRHACGLNPELAACRQPLCERHSCRHLYAAHPRTEAYREARLDWYQQLIAAGWVSKVETEDRTVTAQGMTPRVLRNNYFDLCRIFLTGPYAPIANPMAVTWKSVEVDADSAASDAKVQALVAVAEESNYRWGTRTLAGTSSENYTSCIATILDPSFHLLPQDNTLSPDRQETEYGWTTDFDALPGKIAKSLRNLCSSKVGGIVNPAASHYPEVKVNDSFSLKVHRIETDKNGSGSGTIKLSAAYKLLQAGAAKLFIHEDLLMLYLVYFAADHSAKGQYVVLPDERFPTHDPEGAPLPPDVNLLIDSDNFNDRIRIPRWTALSFFPIYEPEFQEVPWFMMEPLHMSETLRKLVSGDRIARNASQLTSEIAKDLPWNLATGDNLGKFQAFYRMDPWHAERNRKAEETAMELFKENPAATAIHAANGSPWCSPEVIAQLTKLWDSWNGEVKRKSPLPTIPLSGHRLWAMYPYYAGVPEPAPGDCGLVFSHRNPLLPVGLTGNSRDFKTLTKNALDGYDYDDSVYVILLERALRQYSLYVMREPMSPEGGITPRLSDSDALRLLNNGVLPYEQTGDLDWPDLYASIDGELIRQPAVVSDPAPKLNVWSYRDQDFIEQVAQMTRFRRYYGGVVNAMQALFWSELYKPDQDFGMLSDALDDALGGARNPDSRQRYYLERIIAEIKNGNPVEASIFSRVESKVQALHQELEADLPAGQRHGKLEPQTYACADHDLWKETTQDCIATLTKASKALRALANGPIPALLQTYSPATVSAAAAALKQRNAVWRDYSRQWAEWRDDQQLTPDQKNQLRQELEVKTKADIDQLYNETWDQWRQSDDFQTGEAQLGDLMGCYVQLKASRDRRWFPNGEGRNPIAKGATRAQSRYMEALETRDANRAFPREEREAYFVRKGSLPTALMPVYNPAGTAGLEPGTALQVDLTAKGGPRLLDSQGRQVKVLPEYSCLVYAGLEVEVKGYIPNYDAEDVYQPQRYGILVTQVLTAWDGTPFPRDHA